jgi:hypothetical protein
MRRVVILIGAALSVWLIMISPAISAETTQQNVDPQASKDSDRSLQALKIADLPEGKQILSKTVWKLEKLPVLMNHETLFEGMFDSDISGLRGYKRLLQVSLQSKAGTELKKKYILISYKDHTSGTWKVLSFWESTDVEFEYNAAKKRKDGIKSGQRDELQFNYRRYALWASLGGKLQEALDAYLKAAELNLANPSFLSQESFDEDVGIMQRIIGKKGKQ